MSTFVHYLTDVVYVEVLRAADMVAALINDQVSQRYKSVDIKTVPKSERIAFRTVLYASVAKLLTERLSPKFVKNKFIFGWAVAAGEGSTLILENTPTWIIGITNFERTFRQYCISIALFVNKNVEIGIIYSPMLNQLFSACKGSGALLNGQKITVSNKKKLSEAIIMLDFNDCRWETQKRAAVLKSQKILLSQVHSLRAMGSGPLNMAMVACGEGDAYYEMWNYMWDIAAAELIITEAGGVVMDPAGDELHRLSGRILVACTRELAEELVGKIVQFYPPRFGIN